MLIRSRGFGDLAIGESASLTCTLDDHDCDPFAAADHVASAPIGADGPRIAAGGAMAALVSKVLATQLPGPGTVYLDQKLHFTRSALSGDTITATVTVRERRLKQRIVILDTRCSNQRGEEVLSGIATVIAPEKSREWRQEEFPDRSPRPHGRYEAFISAAWALPPLRTAIVHPCSEEALLSAVELRDDGLLDPLLVGPEAKIRAIAEAAHISLDGLVIDPVEHSHAAAVRAVDLAAAGKVSALMKGSLHTDELLGAVVTSGSGLHTERRMSHVYVMDVPAYGKPFIVTDAAINIQPTLDQKRDICQNAVDLLHRLGVERPLVAVLAAVETVNAKMPATLDAAALTVMAARGQITGADVDGPLAFDNAISIDASRTKGIVSPVAGRADILLVPNLEAGNMLAKQLIYFADADAAGLVLGARVPIILTSRADPAKVRLASAAFAKLAANRGHAVKPSA